VVDLFLLQEGAEGSGVHIVKAAFDVEEEGGDFLTSQLEGFDCVGKGCHGIEGGEAR
jgi:hypothetical protein